MPLSILYDASYNIINLIIKESGMSDKARGPGRPRIHADKRAAQAAASRAYRARKKAERQAREAGLLRSDVIDLSAVPPWQRG